MARIPKVGDLQFRRASDIERMLGGANRDVHLTLDFDEKLHEQMLDFITFPANVDECGVFYKDEDWSGTSEEGGPLLGDEHLLLPRSIRHALAQLFLAVQTCESLEYVWKGGRVVEINLCDMGESIRKPDRWNKALARKLTKWINEPLQVRVGHQMVQPGERVYIFTTDLATYLGEGVFIGCRNLVGLNEIELRSDDGTLFTGIDCWWINQRQAPKELKALIETK